MKILMVCLGNICRSPLAEGIMKTQALHHQLNFEVDSAGTAAYHVGELPDHRSIAVARQYGIDITDQKARQFSANDLEYFDVIFVMDRSNYQNIVRLAANDSQKEKVRLILNQSFPDQDMEVPDPYYGGNNGFENVFSLLNEACNAFIKKQLSS